MPATSLWELPDVSQMRTPALLLKEQAEALTQLTNGVLEGRVVSGVASDGDLSHRLQIIAPLLNGYTYTVIEIEHGITLYPVFIIDPGNAAFKCESETNFKERLKRTLTSDEVKGALAGLLVQSRQTDRGQFSATPAKRNQGAMS